MLIAYGDVVTCTIDPAGDTDVFRFDGSTGAQIVIQATRGTGFNNPCMEIFRPDGSTMAEECGDPFARVDAMLDQSGTHTILVRSSLSTLSYTLTLESVFPPSPPAVPLVYGDLITESFDPAGDLDLYTFSGNLGDLVLLELTRPGGASSPCIEMFRPDGTAFGMQVCGSPTAQFEATLDQSGTYVVLLSDLSIPFYTYTLSLQCLAGPCVPVTPADVSGRLEVEGLAVAGARIILRQAGQADQRVSTDANGEYQFETVQPGSFQILIRGQR